METTFKITNITCEACVQLSTEVLQELAGVESVHINIQTGESSVQANRVVPFEEIQTALAEVEKTVSQN